jgi:hypothetical protein
MTKILFKKEFIAIFAVIMVISYAAIDLFGSMNERSKFQKNGAKTINPVGTSLRSRCEVPFRDMRKRVPLDEKSNYIQNK